MAKRHLGGVGWAYGKPRVMPDTLARPQGEPQAWLQLNKDHRAIRERLANNPRGGKAQALPVKTQRRVEIVDPKHNDGNSWLHLLCFFVGQTGYVTNRWADTDAAREQETAIEFSPQGRLQTKGYARWQGPSPFGLLGARQMIRN